MDSTSVPPDPSILLTRLRTTLREALPFCNGTLRVANDHLELYYGKRNHRYLNFAESQTPQGQADLQELEETCDAATFGRNQETVLDETYRKAGKMDVENFVMRFDAERSGLIDVVRAGLLTGPREKKGIDVELYKLNIYGKDAFFKPHVDTPHSQKMFGSLVIVFPTPHEGGELILRHEGQDWTFDAAQLLSGVHDRIAYIAFFSDVEHEVRPVLAGHRVTITYNLFFADDPPVRPPPPGSLSILRPVHANVAPIKDDLSAFLAQVTPGSTLGFGLRHVYALPVSWDGRSDDPLHILKRALKGSDAALFHACEELGLQPKLRLATKTRRGPILLSYMQEFDYVSMHDDDEGFPESLEGTFYRDTKFPFADEESEDEAKDDDGGAHSDESEEEDDDADNPRERISVHWVTRKNRVNRTSQPYAFHFGNGASVGFLYFSVCLIAKVSNPEEDDEDEQEADEEAEEEDDDNDSDGEWRGV